MMKTITLTLAILAMGIGLSSNAVEAAGGSSAPPPTNPVDAAAASYERGLSARDKAWELEKEALNADPADREKLTAKAQKQYEKAARAFRSAIEENPQMYQAHSSLGYALRRTGSYEEALSAYDKALGINPGYVEAIEYRAEAYLGLDQLDEAKEAYMQLFREDRERADELMSAMKGWVEEREKNPGSLDSGAIQEFTDWVNERAEVAGHTASLYSSAPNWSSD